MTMPCIFAGNKTRLIGFSQLVSKGEALLGLPLFFYPSSPQLRSYEFRYLPKSVGCKALDASASVRYANTCAMPTYNLKKFR